MSALTTSKARRLVAAAIILALTASSCTGDDGGAAGGGDTSPTARYGEPFTPNDEVTYHPDVVMIENGPEAITSVTSDGLTWRLKADAPGVDQLEPGKVLAASTYGVGRVLSATREGDEVAVVLGPVALTDVITDAKISYEAPLAIDDMSWYAAPDLPGAYAEAPVLAADVNPTVPGVTDESDGTPGTEPSSETSLGTLELPPVHLIAGRVPNPGPGGAGGLPPPGPFPPSVNVNGMNATPVRGGGLGINLKYDQNGVRIFASVAVRLERPSLSFNLDMSGASIKTATLKLSGAAGLHFSFDAGSKVGTNYQVNQQIRLPVDLSIPIFGLPVPFAVTISNSFLVKTAFSAKDATLSAEGDYSFGGSFGFGYENGTFGISGPTGFGVKQSLLRSIGGLSVGVNGLVLAHQLKVIVGIGAFGFATGPYFTFTTSFGVTRGSDLAASWFVCRGADLYIDLGAGIGYKIPKPVTDGINVFLRFLNLKQIAGEGGVKFLSERIISLKGIDPIAKICREGGEGGGGTAA